MSGTPTTTAIQAPPTLMVELDEKTVPMTVEALSIDVQIAATVSRTTFIATFANPHDRDLEGQLTFPLPDGAALCGYGLDIDGEMVDASLVEKQKARVVFDEEVRKGVDPGLVEHVRGNQFRTRVWPLPAHGRRSVKVEYVSALEMRDGNLVYELPLRFEPPQQDVSDVQMQQFAAWSAFFSPPSVTSAPAERFRLKVSVAKGDAAPDAWNSGAIEFEDQGEAWVAETSRAEILPEKIRIALPRVTQDSVAVEQFADDEFYFRIDALVDSGKSPESVAPDKLALVWDASLSRATADKSYDFELLKSLISRWGSVEIDVFVLRNDLEQPRSFSIAAGEYEPLLEWLAEIPYDGGTSLSELELGDRSYDGYLLFSDGMSTLDEGALNAGEVPVYVVTSDARANRPLLRHLADRSGGGYFDLTQMPVETASRGIFSEGLSLLGVQYEKDVISDVYPVGCRLVENGAICVSGKLLVDDAQITLRFGRGNQEVERRSFPISRKAASSTGLIGRLWAQNRVDDLSVLPQRHADELLELGRRFQIVTPNASLLVLETLEQHLEHGIVPAPTRVKMREEYDGRVSDRHAGTAKRRADKLDRVVMWWQDRVKWWETEFDRSPPPAADETVGRGSAQFLATAPAETETLHMRFTSSPSMPAPMEEVMYCEMSSDESGAADAIEPSSEPEAMSASIAVKPWDPQTPYLEELRNADEHEAYEVYLEQRTVFGRSPSFYFDCADYFFKIRQRQVALRVLTSVAELDLESPQLLRVLAYKLETEGELALAIRILEQVLAMRPEEPQSYRDLALVLDQRGEYRRAAELLWAVVDGEWDDRFPEIETIALMELNRILERASRDGHTALAEELYVDKRLIKLLDQDLRVVLSWDADLTDVDLWVTEPNGEKCYYSHNRTRMGGRISCDFTQGYGPEEYVVRNGMSGAYQIQANYYGSSQQTLTGPATILATVFTNFGRANEERRTHTVRVTEVKDVIDVGEVRLENR